MDCVELLYGTLGCTNQTIVGECAARVPTLLRSFPRCDMSICYSHFESRFVGNVVITNLSQPVRWGTGLLSCSKIVLCPGCFYLNSLIGRVP